MALSSETSALMLMMIIVYIPIRLTKFNGKEVRNLAGLIALVEGCTEEWSKFEFEGIKVSQ